VNGLFGTETVDLVATWVAAAVTIVVLGGLFGERRLFGWSQHLLAGLATGFLALIAIDEVIVPRLVAPIADGAADRLELWLGLALVGLTAGAPWLPRIMSAVPISLIVGSLAAFALGGAVIGTVLPQLIAATTVDSADTASTVTSALATGVTALVLIGFLHGMPRGRLLSSARSAGRWLLVAGIGGWLGYLLLSRLVLLLDRIGFLLGDWLGIGR
jgi:hypothetical protein